MARSVEEIYNQIVLEKNKRAELSALSSPSATAIWRLWAYITAVAHNVVENFFDQFRREITQIVEQKEYGTPPWFALRAREFQPGDQLSVVDGRTIYAAPDPARQLISRVAYKEANGGLILKVAKGSPAAVALTTEEATQFGGYITAIKPAGMRVQVVSLNADQLRVAGTVYYNPLIGSTAVKEVVLAALTAYMENLPFDGIVYRNQVIDAIQKAAGVVDVELSAVTLVQGSSETQVTRAEETASGYLVEDPGHAFSETLAFVSAL